MRLSLGVAVLSAIVFCVVGCGGSDGDSTLALPQTQHPPQGYSVNEANRICTNGSVSERGALNGYCDGIVPHPDRLMPVVGSDGKIIVCADDKRLLVSGTDGPPKSFAGGGVPRCGPTGGGPDGEAIWVPYHAGRGITEAPDKYVKQQSG